MQLKVMAILLVTFGAAVTYFAWLSLLPGVYAMLARLAAYCSGTSESPVHKSASGRFRRSCSTGKRSSGWPLVSG